ncbi:hypothetical protein GF343_04520 [Candidatus Woesearchaeota archaeon]|nr:hypothetical protein [Candidatus Woesearchaeota archaeon]
MSERMIAADCIDAAALAEPLVKPECAENTDTDNTVKFCVSGGREWYPVALPEGADVAFLKRLSGAVEVQEMQYDTVERYVRRESGPLRENHVYEIFPINKLAGFVAEHGLHR